MTSVGVLPVIGKPNIAATRSVEWHGREVRFGVDGGQRLAIRLGDGQLREVSDEIAWRFRVHVERGLTGASISVVQQKTRVCGKPRKRGTRE